MSSISTLVRRRCGLGEEGFGVRPQVEHQPAATRPPSHCRGASCSRALVPSKVTAPGQLGVRAQGDERPRADRAFHQPGRLSDRSGDVEGVVVRQRRCPPRSCGSPPAAGCPSTVGAPLLHVARLCPSLRMINSVEKAVSDVGVTRDERRRGEPATRPPTAGCGSGCRSTVLRTSG